MFSRSSASERQWAQTFATIQGAHDHAYRTIERAIKFEERERPDLALQDYKNGIQAIDEALAIPVEIPDNFQKDESWDKAVRMIHKMKCTRGEVLQRIGQIGGKIDREDAEGAKNGEGGEVGLRPRTYTELAHALQQMQGNGQQEEGADNSLELLFSCDGVKMYYIEPDGVVTKTLDDSTLRIVRIERDDVRKLDSTVFIQVIPTAASTRIQDAEQPLDRGVEAMEGVEVADAVEEHRGVDPSFIYPLIPGVSPCYRTEYGAFIIPDLTSDNGTTIGLVIPPDADDVVLEIFVAFLHGIVTQGGAVQFGGEREKRSTSASVSANIIRGAFYVSKGLVKGAEKTGEFISYSTPTGMSAEDASEKVHGALTICAGAVEGFGEVYAGLEKSASILGASLSNSTVQIVQHKYGSEAGQVVGSSLDTVGNVINVSHNMNYMTPKGIAKRTAKNAGKALVAGSSG
ncbi:spartin [Culex quinquefasciatus]|uniref:Spartin n=1 Tax=Culex quinquefasciatus TaxID=7176 RepID=B0XD67_CULQU|nr:spartin [Culex quinquefasciatus]|eukprot:XP_001867589.1 spartin [Culex quinquefasciatus]